MGTNVGVRNTFSFDLRHVASDTLTSRRAVFVMRVFFECGCAWPIRRERAVAIEAEFVGWLDELCVVVRPVHVVATEASDPTTVHHAPDKIVALHSILMRRSIWEVVEIGRAQCVLFELPIILQLPSHLIPHGPIVVFAFDRGCQRASLRVALDAGIACRDVVAVGWIENIGADRMRHMFAAGAMAPFAAHVPLSNVLSMDVIANRMTAIACRPCRSLHIVRRIERLPPVRPLADEILAPGVILHLPLSA